MGVLEIPDFFFGGGGGGEEVNGNCCTQAYVWKKNESTPSGGISCLNVN